MSHELSVSARWVWPVFLFCALSIGALVRAPAVTAGYPYLEYVDEGHVLGPVQQTLATGRWDPSDNNYPELPVLAIVEASKLLSPLAARWAFVPSLAGISAERDFYDRIDPPQLILVGRGLVLLVSVGIIALVGFLARRLAGDAAGGTAALAAALLPALVFRGAIVTVDAFATIFVLAALLLLARLERPKEWLRILGAGACCGLAAVSKYPSGLVGLAVVVVALEKSEWSWLERLRGVALAGVAAAAAALTVMPSIWQTPGAVWKRILWQQSMYTTMSVGSYWKETFERVEWDLPPLPYAEVGLTMVVLALAGGAWLIGRRSSRGLALGAVTVSTALVGLCVRYPFQAFRNLLPIAAIACVGAGAVFGFLSERIGRPRLAALVGAFLMVALLGTGARDYAWDRFRLEDSRKAAIDWIADHAAPQARVWVMAEATFARSETTRLRQRIRVEAWRQGRETIRRTGPLYLVLGNVQEGPDLIIGPEDRDWILSRYRVCAMFGSTVTQANGWFYRGNDLQLWILERKGHPGDPEERSAPEA
jgi:hypothetical protein